MRVFLAPMTGATALDASRREPAYAFAMDASPLALDTELAAFYRRCGFGDTVGARPCTVKVYTGCLLVPLPNVEARNRYLKYHDLHHLITGYTVGRIGEGEVSAWELGTGSMLASPMLGTMNLIALSTGLILQRRRMWAAFVRGCASRNLYAPSVRARVDASEWKDVAALRAAFVEASPPRVPIALRAVEFAGYAALSMLMHFAIAGPAVIARLITDIGLGMNVFEAVKGKKRADLY
jgi:hypothetical protein